jgi:hypothetical protein
MVYLSKLRPPRGRGDNLTVDRCFSLNHQDDCNSLSYIAFVSVMFFTLLKDTALINGPCAKHCTNDNELTLHGNCFCFMCHKSPNLLVPVPFSRFNLTRKKNSGRSARQIAASDKLGGGTQTPLIKTNATASNIIQLVLVAAKVARLIFRRTLDVKRFWNYLQDLGSCPAY